MSRAALIGENSAEYVNKLLDIWNSGNCAVLIDRRIPLRTAADMMREAGVHSCFIEKALLENSGETASNGITFLPYERKEQTAEILPESVYGKFTPDCGRNEAVVLYSSGTTGKSKGVILSHFAVNTNADAVIDYMKPAETDCIYIAKALSHSSTLVGELTVALKTRTKLVLAPTVMPPRYILANIKKFGVTVICLNPTLLSLLADELLRGSCDVSSLRAVYVSGAVLSDKIYEKARLAFNKVPVYNVYGLSEAGPRVSAQREDCCSSNSVGKPIQNVETAIIDENGVPVPDGTRGMIYVNTPSLFDGYVSGREKLRSLYKGWLNTGDVGYTDKNGELHVIGRADDMIIIDAHKIYPSEIEKTVLDSFPFRECAVTEAELKENRFIACLYVGEEIAEREIKARLKSRLPAYETPRRFICCKELPRTPNGKISNTDVKKMIAEAIETE